MYLSMKLIINHVSTDNSRLILGVFNINGEKFYSDVKHTTEVVVKSLGTVKTQ